MNKYKYKVKYTSNYKRNLKKLIKQGKNIEKILDVIDLLANNKQLDKKYKNHKLFDDRSYKNCYECHIEPDWLLIYQFHKTDLILLLVNTGSHSNVLKT